MIHIPVLLNESLSLLKLKPDGHYLDCTAGFGGHSERIAALPGFMGKLVLVDRDRESIAFLREKFENMNNVEILHMNFADYSDTSTRFDGILMDLGVSSYQLDSPERGFSYRFDTGLDMRMDDREMTLKDWFRETDTETIKTVLEEYSEQFKAMDIAEEIKKRADTGRMNTTFDLKDAVIEGLKGRGVKKSLSRVFMAFRIVVNDEMNALSGFLERVPSMLNDNGRIAVITYHSIEDRLVKNIFKNGPLKPVNKKVIKPVYTEIQANRRARSAKLRVAEKI